MLQFGPRASVSAQESHAGRSTAGSLDYEFGFCSLPCFPPAFPCWFGPIPDRPGPQVVQASKQDALQEMQQYRSGLSANLGDKQQQWQDEARQTSTADSTASCFCTAGCCAALLVKAARSLLEWQKL